MRAHDVAGRDSCRWIARCHRLAGAIDAGQLGGHQQKLLPLHACTANSSYVHTWKEGEDTEEAERKILVASTVVRYSATSGIWLCYRP
jgi:hypothetical protein